MGDVRSGLLVLEGLELDSLDVRHDVKCCVKIREDQVGNQGQILS